MTSRASVDTAPSATVPARRGALGAAFGALALAACGGGGDGGATTSTNATLAGLSLSVAGLTPAFDSATTSYTLSVANGVNSLTLTPTLADSAATVRINGTLVASGATSAAQALAVGSNTLSVVVTAADGSTSRTYTVVVTRAAASLSNVATLSSLVLSAGSLSPAFAAGTTAYTVSVPNATSSLTVTPTVSQSAATVRINGVLVASGAASAAISLAEGINTITVLVTAEDGVTTATTTISVSRAARVVSADATLASLTLSSGSLSPAFSSAVTAYTVQVANGVSSLVVTPVATNSAAAVLVNGSRVAAGGSSGALALAVGSNVITVRVDAEDGATSVTTTITVTRAAALSTDASLSALVLSAGSLTPSFAAATTSYTATVSNTTASITVTPTVATSGATVKVNGTTVASGSASAAIAVAVGANTVSVVVTAADGQTTRTYTLAVTRSAAGSCTITATETQGPYPLLAILSNSAMVRSDIREGKTGIPLTVDLTIQSLAAGCAPVSGAAVYIWHCDKDGLYSGYSVANNAGQSGLTYLRGVQVSDANGKVRFTTIYPGWYAGRITHIHVQVYLNNNLAVTATATTQIAFPLATTAAVYGNALYTKGQNTSVTSFAADNVFSDGTSTEMASLSGDNSAGYTASLVINIA